MRNIIFDNVQEPIWWPGICKTDWRVTISTTFTFTGGCSHCQTVILILKIRKEMHFLFKTRWWWWCFKGRGPKKNPRMMILTRTMVCSQEWGKDWWEPTCLWHWQSGKEQSRDRWARRPDHGECCVVTADDCFGDYIIDNDDIQGVIKICVYHCYHPVYWNWINH